MQVDYDALMKNQTGVLGRNFHSGQRSLTYNAKQIFSPLALEVSQIFTL
jgi:hypothetical protein